MRKGNFVAVWPRYFRAVCAGIWIFALDLLGEQSVAVLVQMDA